MSGARSRRVACRLFGCAVAALLATLIVASCHSGGSGSSFSSSGSHVDVKAACEALAGLRRSANVLDGVNVADPGSSLSALAKAVDAYGAALLAFERVGPASLHTGADAVRRAVIAHDFERARAARASIDVWAAEHCKP